MGRNGSGKSTLANALMGNPKYDITSGQILLNGADVLELSADERGRKGLFLAFQYPTAIPGVSVANFLRMALNARRKEMGEDKPVPPKEFRTLMKEKMALLKMDDSFAGRYINDGFSGGEKKRAEILQMAVLRPGSRFSMKPIRVSTSTRSGSSPRRERAFGSEPACPDHALSADPELHQAAIRPRAGGRADREVGRPRAGA
jgi:ABC-type microcin C transport system duplicated ATPase subunit YejF